MPFLWREAMRVGHAAIDADHQQLIDTMNRFEDAAGNPASLSVLGELLFDLVRFTDDHFGREESVQRSLRYPFANGHAQDHRQIARQARSLLDQWTSAPDAEKASLTPGILAFLNSWMVDHVLGKDMRMRPYLQRAATRPAPALPLGTFDLCSVAV